MKIYCSGDLVSWSRGAMLVMLTMLIITMLITMLITGAGHGVLPARGPGRLRADTEVGVQERGRPQPAPHRVPRTRGRGRGRAARAAQMGRSSRLETQMKCFKSRFYPRNNFQWANSINYKLRLRPSDPECRVLVAEDRGRQQEPLGLPQLVRAALLPRQVAPVPGDPHQRPRLRPRPRVSTEYQYTENTRYIANLSQL